MPPGGRKMTRAFRPVIQARWFDQCPRDRWSSAGRSRRLPSKRLVRGRVLQRRTDRLACLPDWTATGTVLPPRARLTPTQAARYLPSMERASPRHRWHDGSGVKCDRIFQVTAPRWRGWLYGRKRIARPFRIRRTNRNHRQSGKVPVASTTNCRPRELNDGPSGHRFDKPERNCFSVVALVVGFAHAARTSLGNRFGTKKTRPADRPRS